MIIGRLTVGTCYGEQEVPVEVLEVGPRPGTLWAKTLDGARPFTKLSHGGAYQDDTAVVLAARVRDVAIRVEPSGIEHPPTDANEIEDRTSLPAPPELAEDWFLESAYEDRTFIE